LADKNEDYLDQLLNSVIDGDSGDRKNSTSQEPYSQNAQDMGADRESRESRRRRRQKDAHKFFIDDFEKELDEFAASTDISDYELEMEQILAEDSYGRNMRDPAPAQNNDQFFAGLNKAMGEPVAEEPMTGFGAAEEPAAEGGLSMEGMPSLDFGAEEAPAADTGLPMEGMPPLDFGTSEEPAADTGLSMEGMPPLDFGAAEEPMTDFGAADETTAEPVADAAGETASGDENSDDILSLLNGLGGEDEDLAGISDLLQADENNEPVAAAGDGLEIDPADAMEFENLKEVSKEEKGVKDSEAKSGKKGFFAKLKDLFLGPDEDEVQPAAEESIKVTTAEDLDGMSDENLDILRALEGGGDGGGGDEAGAPEDPKAKKKAEKEAKKKAKKEAKEAKKKEKEAKKKDKAAKKAAKPKKEKKPKVKDNTPPLPKLPVFLIFVMVFSFGAGVIFLGNALHSRMAMKNSESYYQAGDVVNAYGEVAGMKFKKKQTEQIAYVEKVKVLAGMQELYDSYETLKGSKREALAVDCLIRVIGHFDAHMEAANEGGYLKDAQRIEKKAEKLLRKQYKVRYDRAVKLYRMRSRKKYSVEIYKILQKVGLV